MRKRNVIIVTLSALILIGGVAACKHGRHCGGFDEFDLAAATDRIASRLDLTESQKVDLERIAAEIAEKANAMHADQERQHREIADLVRQESIDRADIDRLVEEKMEKMMAMVDFAAERLIVFHGTLTPEQREKIATRIENRSSGGCRFGWR